MQPIAATLTADPKPDATDAGLMADAVALHAAVSDLVRVYQFRDRDKICCYDVSVTQCYALEVLVERGPLRSMALAEVLRLDKSTVTRVVDALERKGYVERRRDAEDSRALALAVTASGRGLYQRIHRGLIAQQAELLADLEPEMRLAAADVIRRLARAAESRFVSGVSVGACVPGSCC
jgi:MarR family 2-MHQ and catechol resistance regulon transcriptional repressor